MNAELSLVDNAMTVQTIARQREMVVSAMSGLMKEDMHYGKIAGARQPSLYKPGAQLLCQMFKLRPEYKIEEQDLGREHKRYKVQCQLFVIGTQPPVPIAEGWGEATSLESKHRYRLDNSGNIEFMPGEKIPGQYFNMVREKGKAAADAWLTTAFDYPVTVAKNGEAWQVAKVISRAAKKVENENPADVWNTILKMGCKRAFVEATITATATNDMFTQDMEDIRDNIEAFREKGGDSAGETPTDGGGETGGGKRKRTGGKAPGIAPNWAETVNHIGRKGGPIHGRKLGVLDDSQRDWLAKTLREKGDRLSTNDRVLLRSLEAWEIERAKGGAGKAKGGAKAAQADPAENAGANVQVLADNLDWAQIPNEIFLPVANERGWTQADKFSEITDAEAAVMVEVIEQVTDACKARMNSAK